MALNEHADNKAKERETEGFLWHRKVVCSLSCCSWNLCRIFQSRERVGPSAVPLLKKPNPVSKIEWRFANVILIMMAVRLVW